MPHDQLIDDSAPCPCGHPASYAKCCQRFLSGHDHPKTAEQLMRSRYSAFVLCDQAYLLATWHEETRPSKVRFNDKHRWLGLRIYAADGGDEADIIGVVEYVARYKVDGKGHRLHETSRFSKTGGRWYYLDGEHL
ncbi:YchJ family metal-binding protein [Luminiphilus sp.]|nr:YchJ family metal-binding protein [Luminiphilus sp.]